MGALNERPPNHCHKSLIAYYFVTSTYNHVTASLTRGQAKIVRKVVIAEITNQVSQSFHWRMLFAIYLSHLSSYRGPLFRNSCNSTCQTQCITKEFDPSSIAHKYRQNNAKVNGVDFEVSKMKKKETIKFYRFYTWVVSGNCNLLQKKMSLRIRSMPVPL
jgi:hypothetical protein